MYSFPQVFRRGSLQLKKYYEKLPPVPFKPYRPTLDYIELAVINRGEEKIKNESQVKNFFMPRCKASMPFTRD